MTVKEAAQVILREYPDKSIVGCLDFPAFFAFALVDKGREGELFGGGYDTVNKADGTLGSFSPTDDLELFRKAKKIKLSKVF